MQQSSVKKNTNTQASFMVFLYSVVVLIMISPPLYCIAIFRYIMLVSMILWIGMQLLLKQGKINSIGVIIVLFVVFSFLKTFVDTGTPINARITKIYYYCFFVIVYSAIENELEYYKTSFWLFTLVSPVWLIISITYGLSNDALFRGLSGSGLYDTAVYSSLGVVGYDYVYSIVICLPVFLGLLYNRNQLSTTQFILVIINLALNIFLIVIADYGLAFFAMFICFFVFLFYKGNGITLGKVLFFFIVVIIVLLFIYNIDIVFLPILNLLTGTYYEGKILDLYHSLNTESIFGRSEIWANALKEFIKNPIWGNGFYNNVNTHSEILYALVYYGIIIGGLELVILLYPFKTCRFDSNIRKRVRLAVLTGFVIISLFDPVGTTLGPVFVTTYGISKHYLLNR